MTPELKPCPFCGGTNIRLRHDEGRHWHQCKSCAAGGPLVSKYAGEEDDPYFDWNTRTGERQAREEALEERDMLLAHLVVVTDYLESLLSDERFPPKGRSDDDKESAEQWWEDRCKAVLNAQVAIRALKSEGE